LALCTFTPGPSCERSVAWSWAGLTPSRAPTRIESKFGPLWNIAWASGSVKIAAVAVPSWSTEPNFVMPTTVYVLTGPIADTLIVSPSL
jgi:hypothetical protein